MDRVTAVQMFNVTTIDSHNHVACSQTLGEVRHRRVGLFLWQLFSDGLQGDF